MLFRSLKKQRDYLVSWLLSLGTGSLTLFIVGLAIVVSMMIVLVIDLSWDGQINAELQFAAFITPLLDGLLLMVLFSMLLQRIREENRARVGTEASLKEAQSLAQLGNWELDLRTNALYWSDEIYRIFEVDPEPFEASYDAFLERVHPEDREKVDAAYRDSVEGQSLYEITHRLLMEDGRVKYVHEHGRSHFDNAGNPIRSIGTVQDVTERVELQQELHRLATTDVLTGIHNRLWLDEQLKREVTHSRRYKTPLSIIMFDVDGFKSINDNYGHELGDKVLKHIARTTRDLVRTTDLFARWGGEEFMLLCTHSDIDAADLLAERIRAMLENSKCECCNGLKITASFGVTAYTPGEDLETFLKRADDAMYDAKKGGKNRVVSRGVDVGVLKSPEKV